MFGAETPSGPSKAPLRSPLKPLRSPLQPRPSDTPDPADPRYPCMNCGRRPSEEIVSGRTGQLDDTARWLCRLCYSRGKA